MNKNLFSSAVLLFALISTLAAAEKQPAAPPEPLGGTPEATAVIAALEEAHHRFTPAVKAAYLAWSRSRALAAIAASGQTIPQDFLDWVDGDPIVAATVYGIADNAAARLVLLRSLELDLGPEQVRSKHLQLALNVTDIYSARVNEATLSNPELGISLEARPLLKLTIPGCPLVRVNTRAKDRPLDLNDHIINFLEDNPVVDQKKVTRVVDGKKVVEIEELPPRPAHAWEVMTSPELQEKFNAAMKAHGLDVSIDCGNSINPWSPKRAEIMKAYRMFRAAYEEKGLLPKKNDPPPAPAEALAFLIRIDEHRFPEDLKRPWPKFDLNSPFPVLRMLKYDMPLREREFIWARFRDHGIAQGYGSYLGQIAQYPDYVAARRLQAFDFAYRTYPMMLKDGGVCGVMSTLGETVNAALGIPSCGASQPAHRCFMSITGSREKGYGASIAQSIAGPKQTSGYVALVTSLYPINYGFHEYLDARIALRLSDQLPASVPASGRRALLTSALEINPYHVPTSAAIVAALSNPREVVEFSSRLATTIAAIDRPGCPKGGYFAHAVAGIVDKRLAQLPIPEDARDRDAVLAYLADRSDAVWLTYQIGVFGIDALRERLAEELRASVAGERTPEGCTRLAERIKRVAGATKDATQRRAWAEQLLTMLDGRQLYTAGTGKAARQHTDVCEKTLRDLVGATPEARAQFLDALKASIAGTRTSASCTLLRDRLTIISRHLKNARDRTSFGDELLAVIDGHEAYVPNPAKPAQQAVDPVVAVIYTFGGDLSSTKAKFEADLKAAVGGTRAPESCALLQARLKTLAGGIRVAADRKAWAERLVPIVAGHETYVVAATDPKRATPREDPCIATVFQLAGMKSPAQVAREEAKRREAESQADTRPSGTSK